MHRSTAICLSATLFTWVALAASAHAQHLNLQSHRPMRPFPPASRRAMTDGPARFVDAKVGDDSAAGTRDRPWKTLAHAVVQLQPGDVLYLRGGIYYEHVTVTAQGTNEKPITIRSFPGEMAVIDGGMREFFQSPAESWEPCPDGAAGEFRSVKTYPDLGGSEGGTNLLGNFGDSMVPLHGYRYITDLRSNNEYFAKLGSGKTEAGDGIYCGPGLFYNVKTGHIHVRLAHTHQKALGDDNYGGESDPRKLRLIVAGINAGSALTIDGARNLRVQDIIIRGSRAATVAVNNSFNIDFDGVTSYGGASAMSVRDSGGLRVWNCALRGIAAPWTYRGSLKYRAIEARIFSASGWSPTGIDNHDFELAHSEFTDCVDGVFLGTVKNVRFHHNLLDNVSDDGLFLTATTGYDGVTPGGNVHIYQNRLSRCLTMFAFGVGHGRQKMTPTGRQTGAGAYIYRNVFDFRRPVMYTQPEERASQITSYGRIAGDHGGPLWEPMTIYHNTILAAEPAFRSYYLNGLGGHLAGGSKRRLFNNIVVQVNGQPGNVLPPVVSPETVAQFKAAAAKEEKSSDPLDALLDKGTKKEKGPKIDSLKNPDLDKLKNKLAKQAEPKAPLIIDFQADGNLHWSYAAEATAAKLFARFRNSPALDASKALYHPGWVANDIVANPQFRKFNADWRAPTDSRLATNSPAIDAGVTLPDEWIDPIRQSDNGKPDIGAIPANTDVWSIGMRGRVSVMGTPSNEDSVVSIPSTFLLRDTQLPKSLERSDRKSAIIIQGYPAFDAPLIEFALRQSRIPFESLQRTWLDPADYKQHDLVVITGDLPRAKIEPNKYNADDLKQVEQFMRQGGTLLMMRGNTSLFSTNEGRVFLDDLTGGKRVTKDKIGILLPKHPWIEHLDVKQPPEWIDGRNVQPIRANNGEMILGDRKGLASLYRLKVGKGQLVYVGWDISASLPPGRSASTVEQETRYEQQMQVLTNIISSVTAHKK